MTTNLPVPLTYVQGDTLPAISCAYQMPDDTGQVSPVDITGYTFQLVFLKGTTQVSKTANIDDGPNGVFSFHFAPGDFDQPGTFAARITMVTTTGDRQSWQTLSLAVLPRVGA